MTETLFWADCMLGRLAKWLRILGVDVAYQTAIDDARLVELARQQQRWLLTRDTRLVQRRWVRDHHLLLLDNEWRLQLSQFVETFGVPERKVWLTRCVRCNVCLDEWSRDQASGQVPAYVAGTQEYFKSCPECGRIYWQGTHKDRMLAELSALIGEIDP